MIAIPIGYMKIINIKTLLLIFSYTALKKVTARVVILFALGEILQKEKETGIYHLIFHSKQDFYLQKNRYLSN